MNEADRPTDLAPAHSGDPIPADEDTILGSTLHDTYKVVRFLAEGGMGRVYEAHHTRISTKRFAIKVLHGELKHSLEVRMRFRREAEAAASVTHPNVIGVHDFGYAPDGRPYLVCDYLDGIELGTMLVNERPIATSLAITIGRQLCRALDAAHDCGVIHRDLKPANVFLVGSPHEPDVRVLDFGLSRVLEVAESSVTQTGMVMGTPAYMSPEQAKGERADHRVDVYGVGAVLYACLTGKPPYDEETPHQTVLAVMSREPVRPCAIVPAIAPELEVVVQRAMARNLDERYANMKELDAALARFEEATAKRQGARLTSQNEPPASVPPRAVSAAEIAAEIDEARGVRQRAVAWMFLAALLLTFGTLSAAFGVFAMVAPSRPLLPSELLLATVAVLGSVLTPGILFLRWLRRSYWNNSARMVSFVAAVRAPVLAGVFIYGLAALVGRALDATGPHLASSAPAPNASGWIGWAPFFFGLGLLSAMGAFLRTRLLGPSQSLVRRILAGPIVIGLVIVASGALMAFGYQMSGRERPRLASAKEEPAPAKPPAKTKSTAAPTDRRSTEPTSEPATTAATVDTSNPEEPEPIEGAPQTEIDKAVAGGVQDLMALRVKYPKDPKVLKPLALQLGKEPERTSEFLRVLDVLYAEAPKEAEDKALQKELMRAALTLATSQRAIELMRVRMGSTGADMLFDIVLENQEFRAKARAALETTEVQRNLSPALKIAYDLYFATSCAARVDLLPQAIRDGDERSIMVLTFVSAKPKTGCTKRKPCHAQCGKEAPEMEKAIKKIRDRIGEKGVAAP
ncbi:MAG: protein kinase [Polyangiaceae bacterium]|nr:protein kinase [Polyangiaceae bacterium]